MDSKKLILGDWNVRGRGGVNRNLLDYCKIPSEQRAYAKREDWFDKDKYNQGLDSPNIPYIIDGDVKIVETTALMTYVPIRGNRKELLGGSEVDQVKVPEAISVVSDLRASLRNVCLMKGDFNKELEETLTKGQAKTLLTNFEKVFEKKD